MTPEPNARSFRDHVIAVIGGRDPGVTLDEVAADFGFDVAQLEEWLQRDAIGRRGERDERLREVNRVSDADVRSRLRFKEAENRALRRVIAELSRSGAGSTDVRQQQ